MNHNIDTNTPKEGMDWLGRHHDIVCLPAMEKEAALCTRYIFFYAMDGGAPMDRTHPEGLDGCTLTFSPVTVTGGGVNVQHDTA